MNPTILAGVGVGTVALTAVMVVAQPRRAWRDGAEHRRPFWLAWAASCLAIGALVPYLVGLTWATATWVACWSAVGGLQPSMIADLVDVRRLVRLRRTARSVEPIAGPWQPAPIRWRAPALADDAWALAGRVTRRGEPTFTRT